MIFEGTKNQFFFGLELTRAGTCLPDCVAECLIVRENSDKISCN